MGTHLDVGACRHANIKSHDPSRGGKETQGTAKLVSATVRSHTNSDPQVSRVRIATKMSVVCAWVLVCEMIVLHGYGWRCAGNVAGCLAQFLFHDHTAECSNESSRSSCSTQAYKQFSTLAQRSHALIRPHVNYSSSALGPFAGFVEAKRRARVFERHELNVKFVDHLEQLLNV